MEPTSKTHAALKIQHNLLAQRATTILAMAELIQDYRALSAQLVNHAETLKNENHRLATNSSDRKIAVQDAVSISGEAPGAVPGSDRSVTASASSAGAAPVDSTEMDGSPGTLS